MKKVSILLVASIVMIGCNIKKEEKGELPEMDIDVSADAGELPEYEINWADVNVGTTTKMVKIPKVVIVMEEEEVEVPVIDVKIPEGDYSEMEERTLMVEAEVTDTEHAIEIKKIYASNDKLYVVSELTAMDKSIGDKKMRVSDQVVLNAPDMNVVYYVVGQKPNRMFNTRYKYMDSMTDVDTKMEGHKIIYTK
ncbi:hypothetical protein [Maribacter sp. ACAM166]|uniref:hypothetical protein n=1 Tax=Maribacter sp. ACAM166 TaxID=2508996 RepID=UPI0010FF4F18|nr:hypothetical protein [Maribacter sp. ACAM166]TLP70614.1 hypothetical protein ES765_20620 [Maribacter sp. ACAM166]